MKDEFDLDQTECSIEDDPIASLYLVEMDIIARRDKLAITVAPERNIPIAYFRVYDHIRVLSSKRVVMLHFKDSGMEYQPHDPLHKKPWTLTSGEADNIVAVLKDHSIFNLKYTNWQMACFQWNRFNLLLPLHTYIDEYFTGAYDNMYPKDDIRSKAFVPSTQKMPDTWIYDPPKGEGM